VNSRRGYSGTCLSDDGHPEGPLGERRHSCADRIGLLLLLAGCVPASNPTARSELDAYVARPLQPSNCGTPDKRIACKQRRPQRKQEVRIIWNPEPFYPIIQEPLPDLTPLTRLKWPDE
jgi:hypothetical protein